MRKLLLVIPFVLALLGTAFVVTVRGDPLPVVGFSTGTASVSEDAGTVDLTVSLSPSSPVTVTVDYTTLESGAALAGQDFGSDSGTLTFTPGVTLRTLSVVLLDDALPEPDETFSLVLSSPQSATLGAYAVVTVTIVDDGDLYLAFMPVVSKRWPPIPDTPVLNPISNADGDGAYAVTWGTAYLATSYVLQEDDNTAFSSPTQRYSGTGTAWNAAGKSPGTYYYRVKAHNVWGDSGWSNTEPVTVAPPTAWAYVQNDTGGTLCYEVFGTGIGRKCFPGGVHLYGSFPAGTHTWSASAPCGSASGSLYYEPGDNIHRFWCGAAQQSVAAAAAACTGLQQTVVRALR